MIIIQIFLVLVVILITGFSIVRSIIEKLEKSGENCEKERKTLHKWKCIVWSAFAAIAVITTIWNCVYFTNEQQSGFVSTFGKTSAIEGAGMHFKLPFISEVHICDTTTKGMPIGYVEETDEAKEEDSMMITSDFNFVNIDFYIQYRITDPIEYFYGSDNPEGILKNIAQAAIRNTVGQYDVDAVITTGKTEIEVKVFEDIVKEMQEHHTGLSVGNVTIQDSEPPNDEVANAFKDVENAKQNAQTLMNQANQYEKTQIPTAEAEAEKIKKAAEASKTERINDAKEEVSKFEARYQKYRNNPKTVKQQLYYEVLREILPNMEIIIGEDSKIVYVKGDANSTEKSEPVVQKETEKEDKNEKK